MNKVLALIVGYVFGYWLLYSVYPRRFIWWLRRERSKWNGYGGGLSWPGPWRCHYPDGQATRRLEYGEARSCQQLWGGTLEYLEPRP